MQSWFIIEIGGQSHLPLCTDLCTSLSILCDFSLDALLFTQLIYEITEGKLRKRSGHLLNYVFFIFTSLIYRWNQQVRQSIV